MSEDAGRVMALDVGDRTLGVAISDPTRTIAQGLTTIRRTRPTADLAALQALVVEHEVNQMVLGWPVRLDGRPGIQTRKVGLFGEQVKKALGLPVDYIDERLTTVAAERALLEGDVRRAERRQVVDKVAATLILQTWLDTRKASGGGECAGSDES